MCIHTTIRNPILGHYETKRIGRFSNIDELEAVFIDAGSGCGDYNDQSMLESQLMYIDLAPRTERIFPLEGLDIVHGEERQRLIDNVDSENYEESNLGPEKRKRLIGDDVEANSGSEIDEVDRTYDSNLKDVLPLFFVITNFILELPSAVFDQLSSKNHPDYALIVMLISFITFMACTAELIYKAKKERVRFKWGDRSVPWFYCRQTGKPFGTLWDIIGFACAFPQCILTAINYSFIFRHIDSPIKISPLPVIFAFGLICSKYLEKPTKSRGVNPTAQNGDT